MKLSTLIYILICFFFYMKARATTYLVCSSKDIKTCTEEVTKGEAIVKLAKDPKSKIIKIDFVKLDRDKGTIKVDRD